MQTAAGRAILIQNGVDPDDPTTFLVLDGGRVRTASDAIIHLMTSPGGTWKLLHLARLVPRSWRDWIYGVVARNRYGWFCKTHGFFASTVSKSCPMWIANQATTSHAACGAVSRPSPKPSVSI
jgi:predicted DCC family thiol-disulfide oxidoreductase YuxK